MRCSIFIDGNNFYHGLRRLYGKDAVLKKFNYSSFCKFLAGENEIINIAYYNASLDKPENPKKFNSQKEFIDSLRRVNKLKLVLCKLLKRGIKGTNKYYYVLKEDDIQMAVDIVEGACDDNFDLAIIVSGDGDFVPAVRAVQRRKKLVKNIYFKTSSSRILKAISNSSIELTKSLLDKFL